MSAPPLRLFVAGRGDGRALALVADRRLVEYQIDTPATASRVGEIHLGRVQRLEKSIDAAFVELGLERPALLPLGEGAGRLAEGDAVLVQIVRDAREGKGARLTAQPTLAGLYVVFDPRRPGVQLSRRIADRAAVRSRLDLVRAMAAPGEGIVLRRAALDAASEALADEVARLRRLWQDLERQAKDAKPPHCIHRDDAVVALLRDQGAAMREIVVETAGAAQVLARRLSAMLPALADRIVTRPARDWVPARAEIEEQVAEALEPEVPLACGGSLLVEPGRTLTAIDVNSGGEATDPAGRRTGERRLLEANLEAASEIARQLRLRNIGGIVVVDFIGMKSQASRARVVARLAEALAADPAPCWVGPMSRLGLVELTRRRRGLSLAEMLTRTCPHCDGTGRLARDDDPAPPGSPGPG